MWTKEYAVLSIWGFYHYFPTYEEAKDFAISTVKEIFYNTGRRYSWENRIEEVEVIK